MQGCGCTSSPDSSSIDLTQQQPPTSRLWTVGFLLVVDPQTNYDDFSPTRTRFRPPASATSSSLKPRASRSSARSPPSSRSRSCSTPLARTPPSCCASPRRRFNPRPHPLPAAPRRHRLQVHRDDRLPRPAHQRPSASTCASGATNRRCWTARTRWPWERSAVAGCSRPPPCSTACATGASTQPSAGPAATRKNPAPRSASSPSATRPAKWDPKNQRPELWNLYNARIAPRRKHPRLPPSPTGPSSTSGTTSCSRISPSCRSTSPRNAR